MLFVVQAFFDQFRLRAPQAAMRFAKVCGAELVRTVKATGVRGW